MTIEDLKGQARLQLGEGRWVVPQAEFSGEALTLTGRGRFGGGDGDGRLLLRYKRAAALLKLDAGRKRLDLLRPAQKYEAFEVTPLPPLRPPPR